MKGEIPRDRLDDRPCRDRACRKSIVNISRDLTEVVRAETWLRLLESATANALDAVLITEADVIDEPGPRIVYANEAFTRMTGYAAEEIVGKTPRLVQGPRRTAPSWTGSARRSRAGSRSRRR